MVSDAECSNSEDKSVSSMGPTGQPEVPDQHLQKLRDQIEASSPVEESWNLIFFCSSIGNGFANLK